MRGVLTKGDGCAKIFFVRDIYAHEKEKLNEIVLYEQERRRGQTGFPRGRDYRHCGGMHRSDGGTHLV